MKKIITSLTILVVALMTMIGSVNAASASLNISEKAAIKTGDTVVMTIDLTTPVKGISLSLAIPEGFKYTSTSVTPMNEGETFTITDGAIKQGKNTRLSVSNGNGYKTKQIKITFTATADVTTEATKDFAVTRFEAAETPSETFSTAPMTVTVNPASPAPTPEGGEGFGTGSEEGEDSNSETENDSDSEEKYIDDNGNEITEIAQAGTTYFVGAAIVLVVLVSGALVVRKIRK